ncbi:MAG: hypothetical protein IBX55_12040 [Methyloprofundus sp.]|nr:hypothetical protein [Methyloprofundus sp.]
MNYLHNPVQTLASAMAHALYVGASDIQYEDRDREHYKKTKEEKRIIKCRRPTEQDLDVVAMFPQLWESAALGFGGVSGAVLTTAYTIVIHDGFSGSCLVYFDGRFAYTVNARNQVFWDDVSKQNLKSVARSSVYRVDHKDAE